MNNRDQQIEIIIEANKRLEARLKHALIEEKASHCHIMRESWKRDVDTISKRIAELERELKTIQSN